ncbi:MAG: hypothetical protein Q9191_002284 [Dirinaria sp. TL-2023a]
MASVNRRPQPPSNSTPSKGSTTSGSPRPSGTNRQNSAALSANGDGRSPSFKASNGTQKAVRPNVKRPSPNTSFLNMNANVSDEPGDDDARAEHNALMEELRSRVEKAETASEEYQRQLKMLQMKLDESLQEQGKLEEQMHESEAQINDLEDQKVHSMRQKREMEDLFDSEQSAMVRDKAEQTAKAEEQQAVIQRLKDVLAQREVKMTANEERSPSRPSSLRSKSSADGHFAPVSPTTASDAKNNSKLAMSKDKLIESLRLELAEAQIKAVELENAGGGKLQELEKTLLETRITNARLMEDNESFQLLLSEKTLNGDFSKTDVMHNSSGLGSLAEELESAEGESENYRRLELETKSLREQNKALSLYVESIIGRLLQHKEFENVLEKNPDLMSGKARPPSSGNTNKELPPPPPPKDEEPQPTTFLQRARSVVAGPRKPRPISQIAPAAPTTTSTPPPTAAPTAEAPPTEDPSTARSVPIARPQAVRDAHRRSQSDMPAPMGAAPLVTHMYRGPPSGGSPLMSPRLSPSVGSAAGARNSFFSASTSTTTQPSTITTTATSRAASGSALNPNSNPNPGSSSNSTFSDRGSTNNNNNNNNDKLEVGSTSSPPRSSSGGGGGGSGLGPQYGGAVMTQNRLRPLRLVQENAREGGGEGRSLQDQHQQQQEEEEREREREKARKKANRGSWMPGWMNRGVSAGSAAAGGGGDGTAF